MAAAGSFKPAETAIKEALVEVASSVPVGQIMWHVIWHVVLGVGLGAVGALWFFLFFIMSIFSTDAGKINSMTYGAWAIGALGLIPLGFGIRLLLTI